MAIWKQLLLSLVVIVLIGAAWYFYFPGARDVAARFGVPVTNADAATSAATGEAGNRGGPGGTADRGGGPGGSGGGRAATVVADAAGTGTINDRLTALGDGAALHAVTVTPSASGRLDAVLIASGAEVNVGDTVARLDSDADRIAADKARLVLADAQSTLDRYTQLKGASTITGAQVQSAQLALDNARLALDSAELALRNRQIVAPISGHIGIIQVDAGNAVTPQTVIATIEDRSAIRVSFWMPERLIGAVRLGDAVGAVPIARPQDTVAGKIVAIDNRVDPASGTFEVEAEVPNHEDTLRAGMSFTVTMSFAGDTFTAVNPLSIQWGSDGAYVWKVIDGKASRAAIRIVQRNTETVLVAGEVAPGDRVITEGLDGLRDGAAVRLAGAEAANASPPASGGNRPNSGANGNSSGGADTPAARN